MYTFVKNYSVLVRFENLFFDDLTAAIFWNRQKHVLFRSPTAAVSALPEAKVARIAIKKPSRGDRRVEIPAESDEGGTS